MNEIILLYLASFAQNSMSVGFVHIVICISSFFLFIGE